MVTAVRVFGDQVGSAAPVFLAFLAVHVLAGLTAVATGATAALVRKGSPRHIRAGRWYYRAITVVFASATVLAAMRWRQDYYLFIIGAVAFAAATIGYQHRRRHRPGDYRGEPGEHMNGQERQEHRCGRAHLIAEDAGCCQHGNRLLPTGSAARRPYR